jgi:hypothetical protein
VVVAPGEPGTPVTCCADADEQPRARTLAAASMLRRIFIAQSSIHRKL